MRLFLFLSALGLLLPVSADTMTQRQVDQYMGAAGAILAAKQTTDTVMATCGRLIPELRTQALAASSSWYRRNKDLVTHARVLKTKVVRHLQAIGGHARARNLLGQLDRYMATQVQASVDQIKRLPPAERKYVCLKLITKINDGKWDVRYASPAAFHFLNSIRKSK